jgi:hypothetical protein
MAENRVRVEKVHTGEWEAWHPGHPLPDGSTSDAAYSTHAEAMDAAWRHVREHQETP